MISLWSDKKNASKHCHDSKAIHTLTYMSQLRSKKFLPYRFLVLSSFVSEQMIEAFQAEPCFGGQGDPEMEEEEHELLLQERRETKLTPR